MSDSRKFRIYGVTVHDATTRQYAVPEFEINVLRAAWRGAKMDVVATAEVRDIQMVPSAVYQNLRARYQPQALLSYYPGPERLEDDMIRAADKTDAWLEDRRKWQEAEDARVRKLATGDQAQRKAG